MSAIFGIGFYEGTTEEREYLKKKMSSALTFRGDVGTEIPIDDHGLFGAQKFQYEGIEYVYSEGGHAVVFQGEIYNRKQLTRDFLLQEGAGEGEIILALYRKFGHDFPGKINGIFAVALYDGTKQQYLLARDHVGSCSLYYAKNKHGFFFSTSINGLMSTGLVDSRLSLYGMGSYFSSTAVSPPDTLFDAVSSLRPGTTMTFTATGDIVEHVYWHVRDIQEDRSRSLDDFADELRELVVDAVLVRAAAGGSYGSIVSGGVDSSFVSAVLTRTLASGNRLPVFSIVFAEKPYSDADLQQVMYDAFPLQPHSALVTPREYWDILLKAVANLDTPVNDDAVVGMYKVFNLARSVGCTALFEGEAADELFFTGHVHSERRIQKYLSVPFALRKLLLGPLFIHHSIGGGLTNKINRFLFKLGISDTERRLMVLPSFYRTSRSIMHEEKFSGNRNTLEVARGYLMETKLRDSLNIYYYGLIKSFLPDDLLYKNERMASANGVINRTPFIDYRLVELALKIPETYKVRKPTDQDDGTKIVYKKAIEGIIPDRILKRKKTRGFSIPSAEWYKNQLKDEVHDLIFGSRAVYPGFLDDKYVKELYQGYMAGDRGIDSLMHSIIVFELWLRTHTGVVSK
jgi:asparagine synthase (glutamine-hydrolysing)